MSTNNSWNNAIAAANSVIVLNAGTNTIGASTDSFATVINLGTGSGSKLVTVGSTNTTSALTLNSGSGGIKASGVSGVVVANKNYLSVNTSTGALGSDTGPERQLVLISTQTASSSTNLNFTSGITSTYGCYLVLIRAIRQSTANTLQMLFSTDGGSTYLSSTYTAGNNRTSWNSTAWTNTNSTSLCPLIVFTAGPPSGDFNGYLYINNLATSNTTTFQGRMFGGNVQYNIFGACTTTNINAVRIQVNTGNMTSGTISLYGILNS